MIIVRVLMIFALTSLINACSSLPKEPQQNAQNIDSYQQRQSKIAKLTQWQLKGKIAFIQGKERDSANIFWQYHPKSGEQQLTLTTYLGIRVFALTSNNGLHTLVIDGETYQDTNLSRLLTMLTGYQLPAEQLTKWLFGLKVTAQDVVHFSAHKALPSDLTTYDLGRQWQVTYDNYQPFSDIFLAKKLTIRQPDLLIKLSISDWTL